MRRLRALVVVSLVLAGCTSGPLVEVREYSGRCGDPPHGTSLRVLSCMVMHDDAASGGHWRWRCD